jgi:cytochrome c-type biogenesis protein CcmH/NrfG
LGRIRQAERDVAGALQAYESALKLKPKPDLLKLVQERIAAIRAAAEGPGRTVPRAPKDKPTPW